jgi:hypothetical protein
VSLAFITRRMHQLNNRTAGSASHCTDSRTQQLNLVLFMFHLNVGAVQKQKYSIRVWPLMTLHRRLKQQDKVISAPPVFGPYIHTKQGTHPSLLAKPHTSFARLNTSNIRP